MASPSRPSPLLERALAWAAVAGAGVAVLPALAVAGDPVRASLQQVAIAVVIAVAAALVVAAAASGRVLALLAVALAGMSAWLLAQASYPAVAWLIALPAGAGAGFAWPRAVPMRWPLRALPALALAAVLALLRFTLGRDAAMAAGALAFTASAAVVAARFSGGPAPLWRGAAAASAGIAGALLVAGYVGATTPGVTWFGSLVDHGPRSGDEVAITFDDGPNPPYTLQIRDILDRYGVKATFFTVGKALDARPDVSKALLDDGQLLGDHSYHHDAVRWLDPRYPELQQTQDAFKRDLGVCPAFYRPPHGTHTPFTAHVVGDHGMTTVTWDVSAADWATNDGQLVAKRVLDKVRPGSIILLHDGIDGNIGADRDVVLTALPIILDGLRQRGLKPVTLDRLLGVPGYVENC